MPNNARFLASVALRAVLSAVLLASCGSSFPQAEQQGDLHSLTNAEKLKTTQAVIDKALAGVAQELIVNLDDHDIREHDVQARTKLRKEVGAASANDANVLSRREAISENNRRSLDRLKDEVFSTGQLSRVRIIESFSHLPTSFVLVPDAQSLNLILKSPKVIGVHENRPIRTNLLK